ncbi:MAG: protein-L-isoaspartate(D-aspartate) O-methyltransferase [Nitrospirota bacterium]|nr:MAG: protein-L-isoaspartate(D-aspartate) O-methyltransferase [Nitrospirota bacterium]
MMRVFTLFVLFLLAFPVLLPADEDRYSAMKEQMIREITSDMKFTGRQTGRETLRPGVLRAMRNVPRHEFVPPRSRAVAYRNHPLPIGHGQTISQPYVVALMTDLMELDGDEAVLEIGTGSGYQAAILSGLAKEIYTIEIIKELGEEARQRLDRLGYGNVKVKTGDGYFGWKEHAPFDAIIVTCASGHVPPPLIDQLKPGGKIVIPVGGVYSVQMLMVISKDMKGDIRSRQVIPVRFVPMTGKAMRSE